jgi:hypothetical protein
MLDTRRYWADLPDIEADPHGFRLIRSAKGAIKRAIQIQHVDAPYPRGYHSPAGACGVERLPDIARVTYSLKDDMGQWI